MKKGSAPKTNADADAKADRADFKKLEDLPNIGPAVAGDLRLLKIHEPKDLVGRDPYQMYEDLCRVTAARHDPCVLDTFIAAVRFMGGEAAKPWWAYTAERKLALGDKPARTAKTRNAN